MELTTHEYDEICEIQINLHDDTELDEAIGRLRPEALIELRKSCLKFIDRQHSILPHIQKRCAKN